MVRDGHPIDAPLGGIGKLVGSSSLGRLRTSTPSGSREGIYPFACNSTAIDLALAGDSEQLLDLRADPQCVFEIDDGLGAAPPYWIHAGSAGAAAYHRTVALDCRATIVEPGSGDLAVSRVPVRLDVTASHVAFKVSRHPDLELRLTLVQRLRERVPISGVGEGGEGS